MPSNNRTVAVIGAGLAGVRCALELDRAEPNVAVVLLESESCVGGSTRWAVGSLTVADTRWQKDTGITDTSGGHFLDLLAMSDVPDPVYQDLLHRMCDEGAATLDELASLGVTFGGPFHEPPHTQPRMHNAVPDASVLVDHSLDALSERVLVRTHSRVLNVERGNDGDESGIVLRTETSTLRADAVVIASGDQSATNPDVPGVNPAATGLPIAAIVEQLAARAHPPLFAPGLRMATPSGPWVAPTDELVAAAAVLDGARRVDGSVLLADPRLFAGRELHLEIDVASVPDPHRLATYPAIGYAGLARFEADGLIRRTGDRVVIGPLRVAVTLADGGLHVDHSMHVLDRTGCAVPGVYACGSAALGGTQLGGHGHHLLWAAVTGQWAGASIIEDMLPAGH